MELFNSIMEGISNQAFPMGMCVLLFLYIKDEQKETRNVLNKLENAIETLKTTVEILIKERD